MFLSRLGHIQQYFGLVVWLQLRYLALVWRQALHNSVEVSALLETRHRTAPVDTTAAQLSPDSSCLLEASQLSQPQSRPTISSSTIPSFHLFLSLLSSLIRQTSPFSAPQGEAFCVTFSHPTKVLFGPEVSGRIFAFSQVYHLPSKLWVLLIVYLPLR